MIEEDVPFEFAVVVQCLTDLFGERCFYVDVEVAHGLCGFCFCEL